jgi:S1-C subfamily serine protease
MNADIYHGNSGGPLLNMRGEVVGVNELIAKIPTKVESIQSQEDTGLVVYTQVPGLSFAIPSDTVAKVVSGIISKGSFEYPWLGISGVDITTGIAERIGLNEPRGILLTFIYPQGPA